jgi:hypothetical protein
MLCNLCIFLLVELMNLVSYDSNLSDIKNCHCERSEAISELEIERQIYPFKMFFVIKVNLSLSQVIIDGFSLLRASFLPFIKSK